MATANTHFLPSKNLCIFIKELIVFYLFSVSLFPEIIFLRYSRMNTSNSCAPFSVEIPRRKVNMIDS